jgi:hypothetical protein
MDSNYNYLQFIIFKIFDEIHLTESSSAEQTNVLVHFSRLYDWW